MPHTGCADLGSDGVVGTHRSLVEHGDFLQDCLSPDTRGQHFRSQGDQSVKSTENVPWACSPQPAVIPRTEGENLAPTGVR
jgi:hypothetical protein